MRLHSRDSMQQVGPTDDSDNPFVTQNRHPLDMVNSEKPRDFAKVGIF